DLPSAQDTIHCSTLIEPALALAERQFVDQVEIEDVRLIVVSARVFKLRMRKVKQRINASLAHARRVRERLLERVVRLEEKPLREAAAEFDLQRVVAVLATVSEHVGHARTRIRQESNRAL